MNLCHVDREGRFIKACSKRTDDPLSNLLGLSICMVIYCMTPVDDHTRVL